MESPLSRSSGPGGLSPVGHNHVVQFYEAFLCDTVGDFLHAGASASQPIVVIATPQRWSGFSSRMRAKGSNLDARGGVLPLVFDRFRQVDATRTRRHGGLGLGLAVVRHLVEAHGGTVAVESAGVGKGTTFIVTLPARQALVEGFDRVAG